jgi:uncharacterized membrane-anchored protein
VVALAAANGSIWSLERLRSGGRVVLLELAPVDPRSLMQGDYMALRFAVEDEAFRRGPAKELRDGKIVVRLDPRGIGKFVRRDDGQPLATGEIPLRYRVREGRVRFATNGYFFQEGHAELYAHARYGEFRVSSSGELLLTCVRGEDLARLGPELR